jgi:hypothetical protein
MDVPTVENTPCSGCKVVYKLLLSYSEELRDLREKYDSVMRRLEELEAGTGKTSVHYDSSPHSSLSYTPASSVSSVPSENESTQQVPSRERLLAGSGSLTDTGDHDCSRTTSSHSLKEDMTAAHKIKEWNYYEHRTMLLPGRPLGRIPKGATVFFISSETDDRHMFQPNFYSATHAGSNRIFFSDEVNERKVMKGFKFHCQYFQENNIYYDFRVEAAKRLKPCQPIYSKEEWEEYFTVTTRYPRTSAHSTDDVNWDKKMLLALHGSAASTGSETIYDFLYKRWDEGDEAEKRSQIVIKEIVGDPNCIITWEVVKSQDGYYDPIKVIILPRNLEIFSKFISPIEPSIFVVQYGSTRELIKFSCDQGVAEFLREAKQKFNVRKLTAAKTSKGDIINDELLLSLPDGSCIHVN